MSRKQFFFYLRQKHFLVSEQQNLFPQHMFPARLNWETFVSCNNVSAAMFPSLARPLGGSVLSGVIRYRVLKCDVTNI